MYLDSNTNLNLSYEAIINGKDLNEIVEGMYEQLKKENPNAEKIRFEYYKTSFNESDDVKLEFKPVIKNKSGSIDFTKEKLKDLLTTHQKEELVITSILTDTSSLDNYSLNYPLRTNMVVQNPLEMRMIKQDELSEEKYLSTKITDARNFFGGLGYKKELFKSWCMNNFVAQFIMYSIPFIGEKMQEAVSNSADKITQIRENPLYVVLEKYTPK